MARGRRRIHRRKKRQLSRPKRTLNKLPKQVFGFPDSYRCKLAYNTTITLSPASGNGYFDSHTFRANSLFDPDYTGVGQQPTYFDQLSAVYERYRVIGCKMKLTVVNTNSSNPVEFLVYPSNDTGVGATNILDLSMNNDAGKLMVISSEGSSNLRQYNRYCPINTITDVNRSVVWNENNYASATTTNPSSQAYLHLCGASQAAQSDSTIQVIVRLEIGRASCRERV